MKLKFKNSDICVKFYVPLKTASPASTASLNIVLLDVSWFVESLVLSVTFIVQFLTINRMFAMDVTSTTAARSIRISFTDIVYFAYNSFNSGIQNKPRDILADRFTAVRLSRVCKMTVNRLSASC